MLSPNYHDLGDLVRVTATFTDPDDNDAPIDPEVVNVTFRDPSGNITTWVYDTDEEVVRSAEGIYYADIDADEAGTWEYRWWSTGSGQAAEAKKFKIRSTEAVEEE